jgi:tRNA 2-thiouridine synthesizing protein D
MKIALLVTAPPHHENAWHALQFCRAALARGHAVPRVFFYGEGAGHGNLLLLPPQDEAHVSRDWGRLAEAHAIELVVCVAAALKRGVMDADTARREEKPVANLAPGFLISGLGQLAEAMLEADRLVSFPGAA